MNHRTQSQNIIIRSVSAAGSINLHGLVVKSAMTTNEVLATCERLVSKGILMATSKGRHQTYTIG